MARATPWAPRSEHDITDLRGAALRPRLVLLRRPRHRHPAAHRQQVGRWRLLGHRHPAAHRPRGRAGRPHPAHPLRRRRHRGLPRGVGAAARLRGPDRGRARPAGRRRRLDRAAGHRGHRPVQRLPLVVRRTRRGLGVPVGPARAGRDRLGGRAPLEERCPRRHAPGVAVRGGGHRVAGRVPAVRPVGRPVGRLRAGDVTDVAGPGRDLERAARRARRHLERAARRAGRGLGRAGGDRTPVPAPLRRPADDARRGRPGDGGLRRHAVARRPARFLRRPLRDRAGCDAGRPRAARARARCGRLADRVRRGPRHPHGDRDARLRGRGRRCPVGRPGRRRHLEPHGGRPGRRPRATGSASGTGASTCGACRSTVWPTPPSPPGWGWAT